MRPGLAAEMDERSALVRMFSAKLKPSVLGSNTVSQSPTHVTCGVFASEGKDQRAERSSKKGKKALYM